MNYHFNVTNEKLKGRPDLKLYTGNIQTYTFSFDFDEHWQEFIKFASFIKNNETYISEIIDNLVCIPYEILIEPGTCSFGIYGTNAQEDIKRISSNIIEFDVLKGGYSEGIVPQTPTPDVWEILFRNSIPKIIDGYWHLYNPHQEIYVNTGVNAIGQLPIKGVDYFTDEDKNTLTNEVEKNIIGDIETALDSIIAIQNELIGGDCV